MTVESPPLPPPAGRPSNIGFQPSRGALPGRAATGAPARAIGFRRSFAWQAILLLCVAVLAAPAVTPLAGWTRWSFPAASALLAGWLMLRGRTAPYLTLCLWLFLLTPFVRRVVDSQVGYSQANVLMLAPYLAAGWTVLHLPRFLLSPGRPAQWPMAMLFGCILYGFVLAIAAGRLLPGTIDLLRWSAPPLLACYLIVMAKDWDAVCRELRAWTLLALPLISLYGLYQFVSPPYWDGLWMVHSSMNSIGQPRPFEVRVFGSLNSPASFAYYLEALILITIALKGRFRWLSVAMGVPALAVTLVRSAWLGLAIGLLLLMARAPSRVRLSVLAVLLASLSLAPLALTNPRVERVVFDRIETLTNVAGDKSYLDRMKGYAASTAEVSAQPWGQGFGIANVASKYLPRSRVIDAGPIEILLSLGVFFGTLYLVMVALLLIAAIVRPAPPTNRDLYAAAVTIAVVQALALLSVATVVGEIGVLFWVAIAVVLASPRTTAPLPARLQHELATA